MLEMVAISGFLLMMGVPFLGAGVFLLLRSRKLLRHGVRTPGSVTKLVEAVDDGQDSPTVSFTPTGAGVQVISFRVKLADGTLNVGDAVTVLYDPQNPAHALIAESKHLWTGALLMSVVGVTMCLAAVVVWATWF